MRIVVLENAEAVAKYGANVIADQIKQKATLNLGLATGSSPIRLYQNLIKAYESKALSFNQVSTFNLDEYLGLDESHPQSYRHFMNEHFFNLVDIEQKNTFVPQGNTENPIATCEAYEALIRQRGGVDLQLLGIGRNGHIGFNEPSSSLVSRTRVKTLTKDTVDANKRFFKEGEFQPHLSITMGIGTIMESKEILLIATGTDKAEAIKNTIEGPVSAHCPASILQMHAKTTVVIDQDAALGLKDVAFYEYIEQEQQRLLNAISTESVSAQS
jgi:glucosamine-6-phosphate deaminase